METIEWQVDIENPGHVFASIGMLLLADSLGGFFAEGNTTTFRMEAAKYHAMRERLEREIVKLGIPVGWTGKSWDMPTVELPGFEPESDSPAFWPALIGDTVIDSWAVGGAEQFILWPAAGGQPAAKIAMKALDAARGRTDESVYELAAPMPSSYAYDTRRAYIPLDLGWNPTKHSKIEIVGYPLVDVLSVVCLSKAMPVRPSYGEYSYGVRLGSMQSAEQHLVVLRNPDAGYDPSLYSPGMERDVLRSVSIELGELSSRCQAIKRVRADGGREMPRALAWSTPCEDFADACCAEVAKEAAKALQLASGVPVDLARYAGSAGTLHGHAQRLYRYAHEGHLRTAASVALLQRLSPLLPQSWGEVETMLNTRERLRGTAYMAATEVAMLAGLKTADVRKLVQEGVLRGEVSGRSTKVLAKDAREWLAKKGALA